MIDTIREIIHYVCMVGIVESKRLSPFEEAQRRLDEGDTDLAQAVASLTGVAKRSLRGILFNEEDTDTRRLAAEYLLGQEDGFQG